VRLEESRSRLAATREDSATARSKRQQLHDSVFARLQARLDSLPVIEQAKGVLIAQAGCQPDEAFDILRRASQRTNVKVRDLAAEIVRRASQGGSRPRAGGSREPQPPSPRPAVG
jgi:AmiR/NasT family two-component response regulator